MSQVNPEPLSYDNSASKGAFPPQNDKACAVMSLRRWLKRRRIRAVIPSMATRTFAFPLDRKAYKRRNVIERMWGRLKNWRRIATRYDRLARNYLASLALVSIVIAWT